MKEKTGETLPFTRTKLINIKKAKEDNLDMKEGTDLGNINDFKLSLQRKAQTTLEKIVNFIIEDGEIQAINNEEDDTIVLGIKTSNPGVLIGRHGHTLDALQYIVNIISNKDIEELERRKRIVIIAPKEKENSTKEEEE